MKTSWGTGVLSLFVRPLYLGADVVMRSFLHRLGSGLDAATARHLTPFA